MKAVIVTEVQLLFLSEPAEFSFDNFLLSAQGGQVEKVDPFSSVSCRWQHKRDAFRETLLKKDKSNSYISVRNCAFYRIFTHWNLCLSAYIVYFNKQMLHLFL